MPVPHSQQQNKGSLRAGGIFQIKVSKGEILPLNYFQTVYYNVTHCVPIYKKYLMICLIIQRLYDISTPKSTKILLSSHSLWSGAQRGSWRGTDGCNCSQPQNLSLNPSQNASLNQSRLQHFWFVYHNHLQASLKWYFQSDCISTASNWAAIISCSRGGALVLWDYKY